MRIIFLPAISLALMLGGYAQSSATTERLMTPREFQALSSNPADARLNYGQDPNQYGELRVPDDKDLHPVAILIHGGCFTAQYANLNDMGPMADALKAKGIATWNIEYRRLGQPGGGWPGTYLDVGDAVDYLRDLAMKHKLDLKRVILIGHSAGGHLALWAAARSKLKKDSPLFVADPLSVVGVVNLAGPPDMESYLRVAKGACGPDVVESLLGGKPTEFPERYSQVSAFRLLPIGVPQVMIWGRRDDIHPIILAEEYMEAAKRAGEKVEFVSFADAGHFEIASPLSPTWPAVQREIISLLKVQ